MTAKRDLNDAVEMPWRLEARRHDMAANARERRGHCRALVGRVRGRCGPGIVAAAVARSAFAAAVAEIYFPTKVKRSWRERRPCGVGLLMTRRASPRIMIGRRRCVAVAAAHGKRVGPARMRASPTMIVAGDGATAARAIVAGGWPCEDRVEGDLDVAIDVRPT